MYFAKLFWNFTHAAANPQGILPSTDAFVRSFVSGTLLMLCWDSTNILLSAFLSQKPVKRGKPLTSDAKDPNGSLLNGLKTSKDVPKSFAFWELNVISQQCPDRRKAIFNDIDREGGAAWSQILGASVELIEAVSRRIDETKQKQQRKKQSKVAQKSEPEIHSLPRLAEPPKNEGIFAAPPKAHSRREKFEDAVSKTAKSYGQSADWTPVARARARDVLDRASSAILSPEGKRKLINYSSNELKLLSGSETIHPLIARVLRSPVGEPFRQYYTQRLSSIVFGGPYSTLCPLVDSIESVTSLLIASTSEDVFGKVCADVSKVLRLYTGTITSVSSFANGGLDVHWSDVIFPPSSQPEAQAAARRVEDIDLLLDVLRSSLGRLVTAFGRYARDFGISDKELHQAQKVAKVQVNDA